MKGYADILSYHFINNFEKEDLLLWLFQYMDHKLLIKNKEGY